MHTRVSSFKDKKILLIGDAIIDMYIHGRIVGQALGAAVPRVEEKSSSFSFGGNGLIAANMLELGGSVYFVSVVGADDDAKLYDSLKHPKLKKFFFVDKNRRTTIKRRVFGDGKRLLHINKVDNHDIAPALEKKILTLLETLIHKVDTVVIMDPQHGLLTRNLIKRVIALCKKYHKPLLVDAQVSHRKSNHHLYAGADTMVLNEKEAKAAYPKFDARKARTSLALLKEKFKLTNVIVKLGENGSLALFGDTFVQTPGFKVKTIDAWGAGDAFLAAFSLGDRKQLDETLRIANMWAALSTTIPGTTPPKRKDLEAAVRKRRVVS